MIFECSECETKVDGKIIGSHEFHGEDYPIKTSLVQCPCCNSPSLVTQELYQIGPDDFRWDDATRIWPNPKKYIDPNIPNIIGESLNEATKCYKASAYNACAVMCGRALEGIFTEYKTKNKHLAGGLKELLDNKIIDQRVFEWGEELRKHRNIGAHTTGEKISKDDAKDLLDFANAICEYIFALTAKFERFMRRKSKTKI